MSKRTRIPLNRLSADEIVKACEENYIDYWRCAGSSENAEYSDRGGITYCLTGLPQEIFNVVLKCSLDETTADSNIDAVLEHFRSRRVPMIWHVGKLTKPNDVGNRLAARGFPHDYDLAAMAVDIDTAASAADSAGSVSVERVLDEPSSDLWIDVLTRSWESPKEVGIWMRSNVCFSVEAERQRRLALPRRLYLGVLDGKPVGACMLLWSDMVAGLQAVGTVPEARHRGIGKAVVEAALNDARELGFGYAVVLSTIEGQRLYEQCGFRAFGKLPEHSMYFDRSPQA